MSDPLINTYLGHYNLKEVIRKGGMATIYKAYQQSLDRYVAVKVLFHNRDAQFATRFKREARAVAQLQHHNIVQIYEYGEQNDMFYLVMQYVANGITLSDTLGQPMQPIRALRIIIPILAGLGYAHARGVIHRDLKPGNILMANNDWPMLIDFGIAKLTNDTQNLTMPGTAIGTPAYMAPEQAEGRSVDTRTDLYGIGVMLYEMLTGRVPFDAETPMAVLMKHVYEPPPSPRSLVPDLPLVLEEVLTKALAKDPVARYQSASEMSTALERVVAQLEQSESRPMPSVLYEAGLRAFEEGRWTLAVEKLSHLVAIDPAYEDGADLLEAAREEQEKARAGARQRLTLVRQQRQSTIDQTAASSSQIALAVLPTIAGSAAAGDAATTNSTVAAPDAADAPTPRRRSLLPWLALVALLIAGGVGTALRWPFVAPAPPPALTAAAASTVAVATAPTADVAKPSEVAAPTQPAAAASTLTVAAAPPPPQGTLVHEDDFTPPEPGLASKSGLGDRAIKATDFEPGFHPPGVYHFKQNLPNDTRWIMLPVQAYSNFSLQIELWDNSDNFIGSVSQGLLFRGRDDEHFYAFLLDARNALFSVRKLNGKDNWVDLVPPTPAQQIKQEAEHNMLRLDAQGEQFTVYLNDQQVASFSDNTYSFGMIGMITSNVDASNPHMHFDNLKIWATSTPPAVDLPPIRSDPAGDLVLIPEGDFVMGGNLSGSEHAHIVNLPSFYIDRSEVTNAAYQQCVDAGKCTPQRLPSSQTHPDYANQAEYASYPVLQVSWQQANDFCTWAGKRLPSEAEWEKAAGWNTTTGTKSSWPWGSVFDPTLLNSAESAAGDTSKIGSFALEINQTVDLAGNVSEWTSSLLLPYPYNAADGREDLTTSGDRVFRGGSWAQTKGKARVFLRQAAPPDYTDREIGCRCALTP